MSIIRQLNDAESDQAWKDALVIRVAEAAHHLASVMREVNTEFYSKLPPERLVALLNADLASSLSIMQGNTELGTPVNAWLTALGLPQFPARVPLVMGRTDIVFNGTAFVHVPPVEPEPEPPAE